MTKIYCDIADINLIKIVALLIHAAKIDEKYTNREKKIICSFVVMYTKSIEKNDKTSWRKTENYCYTKSPCL